MNVKIKINKNKLNLMKYKVLKNKLLILKLIKKSQLQNKINN